MAEIHGQMRNTLEYALATLKINTTLHDYRHYYYFFLFLRDPNPSANITQQIILDTIP